MPTSAWGVTTVGSDELLLAMFGSTAVPGHDDVFVNPGAGGPPAPPVRGIALVPPPARPEAFVHVTVWPLAEQLQPAPVPLTKGSPARRASGTVNVRHRRG